MSGDEGCGLLFLGLVVLVLSVVVALAIAAGAAIVVVGAHVLAAWLVLWVARDWVVYGWSDDDEVTERQLVVAWLTVVPILAGLVGGPFLAEKLLGLVDARSISPDIQALLPTLSSVGLPVAYYVLYFAVPPRDFRRKVVHPQWLRFVRAQHELLLFTRLKWIEFSTRVKLWLADEETKPDKKEEEETGKETDYVSGI